MGIFGVWNRNHTEAGMSVLGPDGFAVGADARCAIVVRGRPRRGAVRESSTRRMAENFVDASRNAWSVILTRTDARRSSRQ